MRAIKELCDWYITLTCLEALAVVLLALFVAHVIAPTWQAIRKYMTLPAIERIFIAVLIVGVIRFAGSKHAVSIQYDGGIKAGDAGNEITNDLVRITWQRDLSGGVYVPENAAVYIDYKPTAETNGVWTLLAETIVGAWGWSGEVQNATNYDYNVWAYYIPPEPVHTNGVWTYRTMRDRSGRYAIPLRARVEVNGKAISTPKEVRRDEDED